MSTDETEFLDNLKAEVEAELALAESPQPEETLGASPAEWLSDPTDIDHLETGLHSLLGAVEALEERDREQDHGSEDDRNP